MLVSDDYVVKNAAVLDNCAQGTLGEADELESIELSKHDDYAGAESKPPGQEVAAERADSACYENSTSGFALKISLNNFFVQGRAKMIETKMCEVRLRAQTRVMTSHAFFSRSE